MGRPSAASQLGTFADRSMDGDALQCVRLCDVRREIMWTEESEEHIWKEHEVRPAEVEDVVNCRPRYVTRKVPLRRSTARAAWAGTYS